MIRKILIVPIIILCFQGVKAQSLLHSKPLDFNNGFTGNKSYDRISFHFGELSKNDRNSYFSYDRLVKPLKGGVGLMGNRKRTSYSDLANDLNTFNHELTTVGGSYSPKKIIKSKYLISPSISMGYLNYRSSVTQKLDETNSLLISKNFDNHYLGASLGVLINNKNGYIGYEYKTQIGQKKYLLHSAQAGFVQKVDNNINIIIDSKFTHGTLLDHNWRTYSKQINAVYQYGILFLGVGYNDFKYFSGMAGLKLVNLKLNVAYHVLSPNNFSNIEMGIQYTFNKNNKEKLKLPFEKWLIKLKR